MLFPAHMGKQLNVFLIRLQFWFITLKVLLVKLSSGRRDLEGTVCSLLLLAVAPELSSHHLPHTNASEHEDVLCAKSSHSLLQPPSDSV